MDEYPPPGFRFFPTEDELVSFYLNNKLEGRREDLNRLMDRVIPVLDIYEFNPWELPEFAGELCHNDPEQWFFFIPRQESEARGGRPKRLTTDGYWKATGSPGCVYSSNRSIGVKRTMVFYTGRAPSGRKTEWKMNEYKAIQEGDASSSSTTAIPTLRHEFSLCRVYKKSKCLRAFDRRPPPPRGVVIGEPVAAAVAQHANGSDHHEATTAKTNPHHTGPERTSSGESSSSGDHGGRHTSQSNASISNMPMAVPHNELLWDFDQLDWFYGMQ